MDTGSWRDMWLGLSSCQVAPAEERRVVRQGFGKLSVPGESSGIRETKGH